VTRTPGDGLKADRAARFLKAVAERDDLETWTLAQEVARGVLADTERIQAAARQVLEGGPFAIARAIELARWIADDGEGMGTPAGALPATASGTAKRSSGSGRCRGGPT
jgi:hypothetical protein